MRALTLTQPWAHAVATGIKRWETRSWRTNYRGPLLIHAGMRMPRAARDFVSEEYALGRLPDRLPLGAIVAMVQLVAIRPTVEIYQEVGSIERLYGDYSPGRWAWQLDDVQAFDEPINCPGAQGLWAPSVEVIMAVWDRL